MTNLRDPRWQAIGVLLAFYAFVFTSLAAVPAFRGALHGTVTGQIVFGVLLFVPAGLLLVVRFFDRSQAPRLSRRAMRATEATIQEYRRAWIDACKQNEPRYLWETTTKDYFFVIERKIQECNAAFTRNACQDMMVAQWTFLKAFALEHRSAVIRTDETWTYQYVSGHENIRDFSFSYSLRLDDGRWKVSGVKRFVLDDT